MIDFDVYCQLRGIFVYFCSKTPIYKVLVGTNNPLQLYLQKKNKIFDLDMYLTFRDLTIQDRHFLVCCFGFWRFKIGTSWFDEIGFNASRSALLDSLFRDLTFQDWNFLIRFFLGLTFQDQQFVIRCFGIRRSGHTASPVNAINPLVGKSPLDFSRIPKSARCPYSIYQVIARFGWNKICWWFNE